MKDTLKATTMDRISESIRIALLQRGFTAPLTITQDVNRSKEPCIKVKSEPFQTVPVIFKSIWIDDFGSSIRPLTDENKEPVPDMLSVWVCVHVSYEHFPNGSNGCAVFHYTCKVNLAAEYTDGVFDERIY
jgi:hypothetical protein